MPNHLLQLIEINDPYTTPALQLFDIYQYSFPEEEQERIVDIQANLLLSLEEGKSLYALAGVLNDEVISFVIYHYQAAYRLGFISYLAVKADFRGQGYGSWMFRQCATHVQQKQEASKVLGLCWEVERPENALDRGEAYIRKKRIDFYKKNGAILLPTIPFIAPPLAPDLPAVPYYLMYYVMNQKPLNLTNSLQKSIVDFVLLGIYGVDTQDEHYRRSIDF